MLRKSIAHLLVLGGQVVTRSGWGSVFAALMTPVPFLLYAAKFSTGLTFEGKQALLDAGWWKLAGLTSLLTFAMWLLMVLIMFIAICMARFGESFQLLRVHHQGMEHDFPTIPAMIDLWTCLLWSDFENVVDAARLHIEYGIWDPANNANDPDREKNFVRRFLKKRKSIERMTNEDEVSVDNCFVLHEKRDLIERYFAALATMPDSLKEKDRFLTEATINDGYLAPQYLIAGLMSEFENDWQPVISEFLSEVNAIRAGLPISEFKRIQMFTFDCWLLWGPSIPIGCCSRWADQGEESVIALQYGYGDENNSLPLLPLINEDQDVEPYRRLQDFVTSSPFAIKAAIKIRPVWIAVASESAIDTQNRIHNCSEVEQSLKKLGGAQRRIRKPHQTDKSSTGTLALDYASAPFLRGRDPHDGPHDQKSYYSAYIWVMLIVCKRTSDQSYPPVFPVTPVDGAASRDCMVAMNDKDSPWLGMVPFFEHGNIADDATYSAGKNQLAHKVLAAIDRLLKEPLPDGSGKSFGDNYLFRYACASDDPNCADCTAVAMAKMHSRPMTTFKSSTSIRSLLETLLKPGEDGGQPNQVRFHHLQSSLILDSTGWKDRWMFSGCHLPDIIDLFYYRILRNRRN